MNTNSESANGKTGPVWIAVYTRKSNDENLNIEVTSIDNQKSCCRSYIEIQKAKGWREYPEAFDDPAQSGKSLDRPAIKRILQRIQEGKIQGVIVYKLDRMTRNSRDFHGLLELFEKHGVAFISATESIDTKSPQGRLMTAIMVQFAQYDRELDVERSRDTHLARARKGLWCAGLPPLGYDLKDKLMVVNPQEAELVREMFGLYVRHKSTLLVAKELNRLNYRRKTYKAQDGRILGGKPFDQDAVSRILQRKVYIGLITNERAGQEFPGLHTPLVSPRVFEKVQGIMASHRLRDEPMEYASNKHGFLLKGLIRCGECDAAMVGFVQPKKGKIYRYYRCIGRANGRRTYCPVKCIGADKIEEFVIEKLAVIGSDRPFLEKVVHKVAKESKSNIRPMMREVRRIEERLRATRREMQNLLNMVKSGGNSQEAATEIKRLEDAKRELEARKAALEAQVAQRRNAVYDVDAIEGALRRFARFIYRMPRALQVHVFRILIKRIALYRNKISVEVHELPIGALSLATDKRLWETPRGLGHWKNNGAKTDQAAVAGGSGGQVVAEQAGADGQNGGNTPEKEPLLRQLATGTPVCELGEEWRGRRD
ncbi:MAG TPA: hypothetical protein DCM05_10395, partial [Elusimicrobia bacterium]|nr:hypothetical protein [Elusimicrobiota bacterium]